MSKTSELDELIARLKNNLAVASEKGDKIAVANIQKLIKHFEKKKKR